MLDLLDVELSSPAPVHLPGGMGMGSDPWAPVHAAGPPKSDPWSASSSAVTSPQDPWHHPGAHSAPATAAVAPNGTDDTAKYSI